MREQTDRDELFHTRVHSVDAIIAATLAMERLALGYGLSPLESTRLLFERRPGEFVIVIEDTGSPIEATDAAAGAKGWLAQLLNRGFADRLHASFEGRETNRCEIAKSLGKSFKSQLQGSVVGGSATRSEVEADARPSKSSSPLCSQRSGTSSDHD